MSAKFAPAFEVRGDASSAAWRVARQSGRLQLANRGLQNLPASAFNQLSKEDAENGEKWWEVAELKQCDVSYNSLSTLPGELCRMPSLLSLRMQMNAFDALPTLALPSLTLLDASHNSIRALPQTFGAGLPALRELILTGNELTILPESLGSLGALTTLRIAKNGLVALPEAIGNVPLEEFDASDNKLEHLPPSMARLSHLRQLFLPRNRLRHFSLKGMASLAVADASENRLERFPALPTPVTQLARLMLGHNALQSIDSTALLVLGNCCVELHLQGNAVPVLPREVGAMTALRVLNVADNEISRVPPELGYLPALNRLLLSGNPLRTIRRSLLDGGIEDLKTYLRTRGAAYQTCSSHTGGVPGTEESGKAAGDSGAKGGESSSSSVLTEEVDGKFGGLSVRSGVQSSRRAAYGEAGDGERGSNGGSGAVAAPVRRDLESAAGAAAALPSYGARPSQNGERWQEQPAQAQEARKPTPEQVNHAQQLRAEAEALEEQAEEPGLTRGQSAAMKAQAREARASADALLGIRW